MDCKLLKSKKWRLKKALAASLAVITAFSALPAADPAAAKTVKPYVSLRTTFKTLETGQKNRMTLKNNTIGWKITKVATKDRTIAMVYGKTASSFMIKGKSAGRTTVSAKLKTTARKKYNTKTVRCRINVIAPQDAEGAVVSDQAGLEKALQNKGLKKLEIRTNQTGRLVIPKGTYPDTELTVHAPAADIENNGKFKSITIQAIKPDTWIENAIGNVMNVAAEAARIIVNQGARLEKLGFTHADAKVSLEVNGAIGELSISAKMELSISGKPEAPIPTVIEESAEGTVIETSAPLQVTANASANLTFNEGAENSTIDIKSEKAKIDVTNRTNAAITIKHADGRIVKKASTRVTLSSPVSSSYTPPSVSSPSTPGAIVTTPGSVSPAPDYGSGGSYEPNKLDWSSYPSAITFLDCMHPTLSIAITRSALEAGTTTPAAIVSMSAILTLKTDPDVLHFNDTDIFWRCADVEAANDWQLLRKDETIEMPELAIDMDDLNEFAEAGQKTLGFTFGLLYQSKTYPDQCEHDIFVQLLGIEPLMEAIKYMEDKEFTTATFEVTPDRYQTPYIFEATYDSLIYYIVNPKQ